MKKSSQLIALIGISLLSFTGFLDATIVSTALTSIQSSLHLTVTQLQWIMNAFFLGLSAFMASMGRIADIYGRRKIFYIGILIFGIASLGAGFATQGVYLIIFRFLQGITTAITIPVGIALIQTIYDRDDIAKAMGFFSSITGFGLAIGPVAGGVLVTYFGWPSVFLVNLPFILIGFILCAFTLKESKSTIPMHLDYFGILFLILTIGALVFAVVEGNTYGWQSGIIQISFIVFLLSFIILIIIEAKAKYPIMSGTLFRNRVFISATLFSFAGGGVMSVILFVDPLYLTLIIQKSIFISGLLLFIMPLVVMISSSIIGQVNHRFGPRVILIYGAISYLLAIVSHMLFMSDLNYAILIIGFILFGLGWAIVSQVPAVALGYAVDQDHISVAIGALFSFYNIGAAVMLAVGVSLFHWQALHSITQGFLSSSIELNGAQSSLLEKFVGQPDKMEQIIQQLNLANSNINAIFKVSFITGMHAMFWPLILLMFISLLAVSYLMKPSTRTDK